MTDNLPTPCRPVHLLVRSQSSTFQVSLAFIFPSCFPSSYLSSLCVLRLSSSHARTSLIVSPRSFWEPASLIVPRMCLFLISSLRVTPHIHRSILISFTSISFWQQQMLFLLVAPTKLWDSCGRRNSPPVSSVIGLYCNRGERPIWW